MVFVPVLLLFATLVASDTDILLFNKANHTSTKANGQDVNNCDLPSYITLLPLTYRRELRKIWSSGLNTPKQRRRTEKLISELPVEIREKIKSMTTTTTTEAPSETSFLKGLAAEHIHEFNAIMANRSLSVLERSEKLREWGVDLLDLEAMDRLEQYVQFLERRGDKFREKLRRLSPSAISVYNRLEALKEQRKMIFDGMNEAVAAELIDLWRLKCNKQENDLQVDEEKLACSGEGKIPGTTTETPTTTSTSESTKKWRPFPSGIPQTDPWQLLTDSNGLSRLLQTLFTRTEK